MDFLETEELGTIIPKRCMRCVECKDCSLRSQDMSRRVQEELRLIESGMSLDKESPLITSYPIVKDPSVLTNNYKQAVAIQTRIERSVSCFDTTQK